MAKRKGPDGDFYLVLFGIAIGAFGGFFVGAWVTLILVHWMLVHHGLMPA